jgi:tRNA uridine 5-carbamoylmethylation protein Kti12
MAQGFRTTFSKTIHEALQKKNIDPINELTAYVDKFISDNQITVTKYDAGRRRK